MPEYLAPAVYMEEVPSANQPIEGASTSTAAMVGMTARGPVNTPTLVTSAGSYGRLFGGLLDYREFSEGRDSLPHAAAGFFANGGSRLYVVRVVGDAGAYAHADLYGDAPGATAGSNWRSRRMPATRGWCSTSGLGRRRARASRSSTATDRKW